MGPSANEDWTCYCIHIRVTLGEERGDLSPQPPHAWTSSSIADILQEGLEERIPKAMVLASGEDNLSKRGSLTENQGTLHSEWLAQLFGLGERFR